MPRPLAFISAEKKKKKNTGEITKIHSRKGHATPPRTTASPPISPITSLVSLSKAAISLSHLVWVFALFFPKEEETDLQRIRCGNKGSLSERFYTASEYSGSLLVPDGAHKFVTGPQSISGSAKERKLNLAEFGWKKHIFPHPGVSYWTASCNWVVFFFFAKPQLRALTLITKSPSDLLLHVAYFAGDCRPCSYRN